MIIEGVLSGVWSALLKIIDNLVNVRLNSILNPIMSLLPDFTPLLSYLSNLFDIALNYCLFILDASFIQSAIFSYLIFSLIFKISAPVLVYVVKLIVKWWHSLAP